MKKLVLSDLHKKIGGKMINFSGFNMPVQYTGVIDEHNAVRNNIGVFDVSHMGQIFVSGDNASKLVQYITSNDVDLLYPGKVQYTCFPNTTGGIVDDLLLYKLSEGNYLLVVNASNIVKDLNWIIKHNSFGCTIEDKSNEYSLLAVQGPKSIEVLQNIINSDLTKMKYYTFVKESISNINDVIISRTGYTGEIGFELYVKNNYVEQLWNLIFSLSDDIKPIGLAARDTLRLEMGYCLYGNDIDDTTSPIEAGLGWITKFNNDFINLIDLKNQKDGNIKKKLVGLELIDKGIARKDYNIFDESRNIVGVVTSGTMSPSLNKPIAMGYVSTKHLLSNKYVFIEIRNKFIKAKISTLPFVK